MLKKMTSYEKLKARYEILKEAMEYLEKTCTEASRIKTTVEEYDQYYEKMTPTEVFKYENKFVADVVREALLRIYSI